MVAVTLVSRAGYFRQEIDPQGRQIEHADDWDPSRYATRLQAAVALSLEDRQVWVGGWLYVLSSRVDGGGVPVLLLDTDLSVNDPRDRDITHYLYGGDETYRIKQEVVLGVGGIAMLQALGFELMGYHMNEGHSAFLTLALLRATPTPAKTCGPARALTTCPGCGRCAPSPPTHRWRRPTTNTTTVWCGASTVICWTWDGEAAGRRGQAQHDLPGAESVGVREWVAKRHAEVSRKMFPAMPCTR